MGLTDQEKNLIRAVAENDIRAAKKVAYRVLEEDTTQKNRMFVNRYKNILTSEGANFIELPADLKDIMLCEDVSLSFRESRYYLTDHQKQITDEIFKMSKVSQKLMEMQVPYKNASLLYGPPGTGKTMFGRYIAYKMSLPFCYLNFSKVIDSHMGVTSRNLSKAFAYASSNPCVFMLDEVDTISCNRSKSNTGSEKEIGRITVTLMQEFDRLANDIVIIAATNRVDMIDEAFISRFPQRYEMNPFSPEESREMVDRFLADIGIQIPEEKLVIPENVDQRTVMNHVVRLVAEELINREV